MRIDLHADTPLWQHWLGYDMCRAHRAFLPWGAWLANLDLPRMDAAALDAQLFGLVSLPFEFDGFATIQRMIGRLREASERSNGHFVLARTGSQLAEAQARGQRVGMLTLEGAHSLRGRMERADWLIAAGVVSVGLAHFHRNAACSPAFGWGGTFERGLTPFGHDLVAHLAAHRVILDLTHINRRGFFEALACASGAVMVSHTGVGGAYAHWRNLDDAQIRAVAERGGIIGIMFSRHFLGGHDIDAVVAHMRHLINIGGAACAALGSDFDGFIVPVKGLRDITGLPLLAESLARAGLSAAQVDGVMGHNAWRFLCESRG